VGQSPWYYNHTRLCGGAAYYGHDDDPGHNGGPIWSFGHGLSYTTFTYSNLKIDGVITSATSAVVHVTVNNKGKRQGDEVVQLYLHQDFTSLVRPVMELQGFQRVTLNPGESRTVSFPVGFEQIKFWKDGRWVAEPGVVQVMVGSSSADIRLQGEIQAKM